MDFILNVMDLTIYMLLWATANTSCMYEEKQFIIGRA